jgi:hypothetical protein
MAALEFQAICWHIFNPSEIDFAPRNSSPASLPLAGLISFALLGGWTGQGAFPDVTKHLMPSELMTSRHSVSSK